MKVVRSRKEVRQHRILAALEANPALRVTQLADELAVSAETIRRDLDELVQLGQVNRTHGGAVRNNRSEPALNERLAINVPERRAIARAAAERHAGAGALLLGGGATMTHFARELRLTDREASRRHAAIVDKAPLDDAVRLLRRDFEAAFLLHHVGGEIALDMLMDQG